jgi:hypothetical protein
MRAVDVTRNVDFQTVAFSALLYRLGENGDWTLDDRTEWLWDRTYDEQIEAFPGNYWRSFKGDTRVRKFVDFVIDQPGVYEVRIHYRWYAARGSKTHDVTEPVFYHLGPFQNRDQSACDFPGLPLLEGVYSGLTDEQQTVSLKVGPLYSAPPRATAWSLIESFEFTTTINCIPAVSAIDAMWRIDATRAFFIDIRSDGTFSSTHAGPVPARTGRLNATATYYASGRIDRSGNATGIVQLSQVRFDERGVHHDCTGGPHSWSARVGP